MIARWKVQREFARLRQQLRAVPEFFWEPFARRRHDRSLAQGLATTSGKHPIAPKIALVLLYQPRGLARSTILMCQHLVANGYAVLAISNAPLSDADRTDLASHVWRIIERPNFGYDFGGYRDGLWHLSHWGIKPERLVILNDSIWFPLRKDDDTLARMETMDVDVAGTVLRHRGAERFLESYLYSIRGTVLEHPGFRTFWRDLRLTSNKYKVIRRGERGFSAALIAAGLRIGGLFTLDAFKAGIAAASDHDLRLFLRFTAHQDDRIVQEGRALAQQPESDIWRDHAQSYIERLLAKGQFYSSLPVAAVRLLGYPIMKKSSEPVSAQWRAMYVSAVRARVLEQPTQPVFSEIMTNFDKAPQQ